MQRILIVALKKFSASAMELGNMLVFI